MWTFIAGRHTEMLGHHPLCMAGTVLGRQGLEFDAMVVMYGEDPLDEVHWLLIRVRPICLEHQRVIQDCQEACSRSSLIQCVTI